jgi:hypothetical protein
MRALKRPLSAGQGRFEGQSSLLSREVVFTAAWFF